MNDYWSLFYSWEQWLNTVQEVLFFFFLVGVLYFFFFALFSLKDKRTKYPQTTARYRYAVLVTLSKYDDSIFKTLKSFEEQQYPSDKFDLYVIHRDIPSEKLLMLKDYRVKLIDLSDREYESKYRGRMIESALGKIHQEYDVAIVMKKGNTVDEFFIDEINKAYHSGGMAIQTHRISMARKSNTSILSALGEEINNAIFRRGHVNLGFSSSLIGSGMAFNFGWLKKNIIRTQKCGLTKQLESHLLRQGVFVEYLEHVHVYEDKAERLNDFNKQRKYWYTSERYSLWKSMTYFPGALFSGNFDYCDKIIQWMMPSKYIILMLAIVITVGLTLIEWSLALKWWILLFTLILSFLISVPSRFMNGRTLLAFFALPLLSLSILSNLLRRSR
jgi:hypothetical protein